MVAQIHSVHCTRWMLRAFLAIASLTLTQSKSFVSVHIPFSLYNRSGEEHVTARYGITQPQGSIASYVYALRVHHDLCLDSVGKHGNDTYPQHEGALKPPFMLIVSRSPDCTTVTQARHAQMSGAAALIVTDTSCRCSDKACMDTFGAECSNEDEVLVNDGSAADVTIPSFLLYRVRGNVIRDLLHTNQPVLMEFTWGLKDIDVDQTPPSIHFHIWTTAHDPLLDIDTYKNFKTIATALSSHGAKFEPRYSLISGDRFNCNHEINTNGNGTCDHLCTNHGRYCALHRDNLSGEAIVAETLRRLCVWQDYGEKDANHYWDYILNHIGYCSEPEQFVDVACYTKAITDANMDPAVIDRCMTDSGGLEADESNAFLEKQIKEQDHAGILSLPAIVVENHTLDEPTSFQLWEGLCRKFWSRNLTTTPDVCFTCSSCPNVLGCVEAGHCVDFAKPVEPTPKKEKKRHRGWSAFFWIISIAAAVGGAYYYYKRLQDAEGIRGHGISSYFQLAGEEL